MKNFKSKKKLNYFADNFMNESMKFKYSYKFNWLGRPIIQYPQDIIAVQEIIWKVKPDLIIETGIAHGGSLVLSASMLSLIDYCEAIKNGKKIDFKKRKVVGVDIDIRKHNRIALEKHPLKDKMILIEGSSIEKKIYDKISRIVKKHKKIMVFLDSNHTHDHVFKELELYAKFVSKKSYCVVFDTVIEDLDPKIISNRPWDKGNSPWTALKKFLLNNKKFIIDKNIQKKLLITVCKDGYLLRK
jgi:cephalosporin hydroxylase